MEQYAFGFFVLAVIVVCVILFGPSATIAFLTSIFNSFMSLADVLGPWILGISILCVVIWLFFRHKGSKLDQDDYYASTPQSGKRKQKNVTHKEPSNKTGQRSGGKKSSSKKTREAKANGSSKKKS